MKSLIFLLGRKYLMTNNTDLYLGNALLNPKTKTISNSTVTLEGEVFFKIDNYNAMDPFFMTIVSDVDLWMYCSSSGGLTCGRKNAESALFPYYTDDKIHDSHETTGAHTMLVVHQEGKDYLWLPFTSHNAEVYKITRNLYKNVIGNKIMFEEINHDLEVAYTYTWKSSDRFGFIKQSTLTSLSDTKIRVKVLDGLRNILPYGVNTMLQTTKSTLVDGYKRCELVEEAGLGLYTLSSILTDKAEPSESLKATTVWSTGLNKPTYLLSELQVQAYCQNLEIRTETDIKGRRGAFYVGDTFELSHKDSKEWYIVADLNQGAVQIENLVKEIEENPAIAQALEADVAQGDANLKTLVFEADGCQLTANEKSGYRHFSNTLYNIMRGGIYADGYQISRHDFMEFVASWNKEVYEEQGSFLKALPETINYSALLSKVADLNCGDFHRLVLEYLPLTYSRRHGDPSRPWNKFNIDISKADGSKKLKFEGNWRDIFQNWEALSVSFSGYIESIIAKFVNASTADGYNPYRITKEGIDWELLDPEDPWSNIGYWGDHQLIYLLKLVELSQAYDPAKLKRLLNKEIFVYANVPYRIKGFEALTSDPRNSIIFDDALEAMVEDQVKTIGSDGRLIFKGNTSYKVSLMEKLLVTLLTKFSNYVPEGGIWMNTQRPEWNDANNALVGYGLSMVTLYYLHRFQVYMLELIDGTDLKSFDLSKGVFKMFNDTMTLLSDSQSYLGSPMSDQERFTVVKALGSIGERYRNSVYDQSFSHEKEALSKESLKAFIEVSLLHLKDSIGKNRREDGLYHAYNLIKFGEDTCSISYLNEMLEGQVAVLSSKSLEGEEVVKVLGSLRNSQLYRQDQNSYMLYPDRDLPKFLEKNIVAKDQVMSSSILKEELEKGYNRFIEVDVKGQYHFNGSFRNSEELVDAMKAINTYSDDDIEAVGEIFTDLFNHHAFTGRSGTLYKYEGLGCIYWHMVSKLVLASQENYLELYHKEGMTEVTSALMNHYEDLKDGIGLDKSPEIYGAFTTDAYSHTPGFTGVQQPGMTGQVKEDFISRFGELGLKVDKGQISFDPSLLSESEFLKEERTWVLPSAVDETTIQLEKGSLGFTFCTVPMIYHLASDKHLVISYSDGGQKIVKNSTTLEKAASESIFSRDQKISRIDVYLSLD